MLFRSETLRIKLALKNADADIEKLKDSGAAQLIPNTISNKASVLARAIKLGILDAASGDPEALYKDALLRAQIYNNTGTLSFIFYYYAAYLEDQNNRLSDARALIVQLDTVAPFSSVFKQFVHNQASVTASGHASLLKMAGQDATFKKFLIQNG